MRADLSMQDDVVDGSLRYVEEKTRVDTNGYRNPKHKESSWKHFLTDAEIKEAYAVMAKNGDMTGRGYAAIFSALAIVGTLFWLFDGFEVLEGLSPGQVLMVVGGLIVFLVLLLTVGGNGVERDWEF